MKKVLDKQVKIGFYAVTVTKYLSELYKPFQIIPEAVQNAIDGGIRMPKEEKILKILVKVDMMNRMIWTIDNACGASHGQIKEKFEKLGKSFKTHDKDAIGQKGIGNIAGISISNKLTMVTIDRTDKEDKFRKYTLNANVPMDSEDLFVNCDYYEAEKLSIPGCWFENATTMVRLEGVSLEALREIRGIESIEEELVNRYAAKLAKCEIKIIWINEQGSEFSKKVENIHFRGQKLPPEGEPATGGRIVFDLNMSPAILKDPRLFVVTTKGDYSIKINELVKRSQIDPAAAEVLLSGYFEGNIRLKSNDPATDFCTLSGDRLSFVYDHDLAAFKRALNKYCQEKLARFVSVLEDNSRNERLQKASEIIAKEIEAILKDHPEMEPKGFHVFEKKRTGTVEKPPAKKTPKQVVDEIIHNRRKNPGRPFSDDADRKKPEPKRYKPENGLNIMWYTPTAEEPQNWRSRTKDKLIQINLLHQDCMVSDNRGQKSLISYVMQLCFKEFTCSRLPDNEARRFSDTFESMYLEYFHFLNS
ncbi:MAG: ATP-binding protein [Parcubacteria group bacterium]